MAPYPEQAFHSIRKASDLRNFFLQLQRSSHSAHARGEFPYEAPYDIRSDAEYWRRLLQERQQQQT